MTKSAIVGVILLGLLGCKEQVNSSPRVSNNANAAGNKDLLAYHIKASTSDEEIIKKMEAAKLVDSANPEVYNLLGITYSKHDNHKKAAENFLKVIELMPDNIGDYNALGTEYMDLDDGPSAIKYLSKGLELCQRKPKEYNCTDIIQNIASTYYATKVNVKKADDLIMVISYSEKGLQSVTATSDLISFTRFKFLIAEAHNNIDNSDNIEELEKAKQYYQEVLKYKGSPWYEDSAQKVILIEHNLKILKKR